MDGVWAAAAAWTNDGVAGLLVQERYRCGEVGLCYYASAKKRTRRSSGGFTGPSPKAQGCSSCDGLSQPLLRQRHEASTTTSDSTHLRPKHRYAI